MKNKIAYYMMVILAGLFLTGMAVAAQDNAAAQDDKVAAKGNAAAVDSIKKLPYIYPDSFKNIKPNVIEGAEHLRPFWKKLSHNTADTMKVMMVGDSHVRGNIFPRTLEAKMMEEWKRIDFSYVSKNGVQLNYFLKPEQLTKIVDYHPDLLIVSVGTNESHGTFVPEKYQALMKEFTDSVHNTNPECVIMFTTTPGSHIRKYGYRTVRVRKRRTKRVSYLISKEPNAVNGTVSDCQADFCRRNHYAIWNLFDIAGGNEAACNNWVASGLMAKDAVHFQKAGYELHAGLLFEALDNSYKAFKK